MSPSPSAHHRRPSAHEPIPAPTPSSTLLPPLVVAAAFLAETAWTWRRLGSLLIDGGRELEVPRRLAAGAVLYSDVRWYWGPFAPWVNSALYRLFGVSSDTLMWAGLATASLACAALYLLARRFLGPWISAAVSVSFLFTCAFGARIDTPIFSYVSPFNFSATYGMTLATWSVLFLLYHLTSGRPAPMLASGVLAGLAALTKAEPAIAVAAAHLAYLAAGPRRISLVTLGSWGAGLVIALAGYATASAQSDGAVWSSMGALANEGSRHYIAETMGLRDTSRSLVEVGSSAVAWLAVVAAIRGAAGRPGASAWRRRSLAFLAATLAFAVPTFALGSNLFRIAPLALGGAGAWLVFRRYREGPGALEGKATAYLVLFGFALVSLARIPLRAGPDHYGFYLLPPTLVCCAVMMALLARGRGGLPSRPGLVATCTLALFLGTAVDGFAASWPLMSGPYAELRTKRVHLHVDPAGPEAHFIPWLANLPSTTVCAAIPEGAGFVFAAGLTPTADGMTSYLPMELSEPTIELALVEAWARRPPDVVLYFGADLSPVFGYVGFSHDYGRIAGRWLFEHYMPYGTPVGAMVLLVPRAGL